MKDVMIDFEAFGNKCLCQVGAVYFDKVTGELGAEFKANIDAVSHIKRGGLMDPQTVYWWLSQSPEAIASILAEPRQDIVIAMAALNEFIAPAARIWSHATYDFVILTDTLKDLGIQPSFKRNAGLDLRTLVYLAGTTATDTTRTGLHHDGLEDAKHQVKYCVAALNTVKTNKSAIKLLTNLTS